MQKKTTVWYTLGEAEKAAGVPRTRLDHACRVGRLQYRRSETGARLLSHDLVEKLRKQGLKAFPRPYDPIASSSEHEASPSAATPGAALTTQRERLEQKRGELEEMRVNRDLRRLKEQQREENAERRAATTAERQARAEERAEAKLEAARQTEAREQAEREAEANDRRRQWEIGWLDYALKQLPRDVAHWAELDVSETVAALLPKLDNRQPEQLTKRLIQAAIEKGLQPWQKQKEVEKIIKETRNQLPAGMRSWSWMPTEWEARAMRAAADAVAQLGDHAPLATIRGAAVEASKRVCAEYEAWKATEDHRRACEHLVECVFDGDDAREAVWQELEKLPVGATRSKMENARDAALAPFRAATKAAADADRYLQHVSNYIEELGNEETGDWELGDWFERNDLAAKLRAKLRPLLIQKLLENSPAEREIDKFIEDWVDQELELED